MNAKNITTCVAAACLALLTGCGPANAAEAGAATSKTSATQLTTNENGCVSRTFTESSVTTNGNLVTEHRRETRTNMDVNGNILETHTSEYAQSYNVGDTPTRLPDPTRGAAKKDGKEPAAAPTDAFLGLKFGDVFNATNFVKDADEPLLLRTTFKPKKPLAGFDDYYVYVTPKTHQVAKIYACAKEAVEPGGSWRRHYLIEALEKRYQTWARLCSFWRPYYAFDVAPDRYVTVCLTGATESYETVVAAWDEGVLRKAGDEYEQLREEARKNAAARRNKKVDAAADAF
ncbi:MAG: hypothetical protein MJ240_12220 [Kiritimatiellae bacterium]|nr:hypothetical protein [Kiritimatiellia bacterium]